MPVPRERTTRDRTNPQENSAANVSLVDLDLADLDSVSACAYVFENAHDRLDLLINNAGVMVPPFSRTRQGFELQFGTNHLGHSALASKADTPSRKDAGEPGGCRVERRSKLRAN
jgi:NAD(P)-dependent dehydrogenase (short-subunit alcohol dehydrogenase family)